MHGAQVAELEGVRDVKDSSDLGCCIMGVTQESELSWELSEVLRLPSYKRNSGCQVKKDESGRCSGH